MSHAQTRERGLVADPRAVQFLADAAPVAAIVGGGGCGCLQNASTVVQALCAAHRDPVPADERVAGPGQGRCLQLAAAALHVMCVAAANAAWDPLRLGEAESPLPVVKDPAKNRETRKWFEYF